MEPLDADDASQAGDVPEGQPYMLYGRVLVRYTPALVEVDEHDEALRESLDRDLVSYRTGYIATANPHRFAAAYRFTARSRAVETALRLSSQVRLIGNDRPQHDIVALYHSDWEQQVFGRIADLRFATFRDKQRGLDDVRGRAVGSVASCETAPVYVGFDVSYYFSPEDLVEKFHKNVFVVAKKGARQPGVRILFVSRRFPTQDHSLYVETFSLTDEDIYMEGWGRVDGGEILYHASSYAPRDSVYSHPVSKDAYLYTHQERYVRHKNLWYVLKIHTQFSVGPYVGTSVLLQRVWNVAAAPRDIVVSGRPSKYVLVQNWLFPGLMAMAIGRASSTDTRSAAGVTSLRSAVYREAASLVGHKNWQQLMNGVGPDGMSQFLMDSINATVNEAIRLANGRFDAVSPSQSVYDAVVEGHALHLSDRLGLSVPASRVLSDAMHGSRLQAVVSVGAYARDCVWSAASWLSTKVSDAWEYLRDLFARAAVGNAMGASLFSVPLGWLLKSWRQIEARVSRTLSVMRHMTLRDWFPYAFREADADVRGLWVMIGCVVFEELIKHAFSDLDVWITSVICIFESLAWLAKACFGEEGEIPSVIAQRLAACTLHFICLALPLHVAIPVHAVWNYLTSVVRRAEDRVDRAYGLRRMFRDDSYPVPVANAQHQPGHSLYEVGDTGAKRLVSEVDDIEEVPRRWRSFFGPGSEAFASPGKGLGNATVVSAARFNAPIPEPELRVVAEVHSKFRTAVSGFLDREHLRWDVWTVAQLRGYIAEHKAWPKGRKLLIQDLLDRAVAGVDAPKKAVAFTKTDELLLIRLLGAGYGVKCRPIFPLRPLHVPMMCASLPFKTFLDRRWFLIAVQGNLVWSLDPDSASGPAVASITYFACPTPKKLGSWATAVSRERGYHVAAHGDDNLTVLSYNGSIVTRADDLGSCDKTCHKWFQREAMWFEEVTCSNPDLDREIKSEYMSSLTGDFVYQTSADRRVVFTKQDQTTNTGQPNTSQLAYLVQMVNFPNLAEQLQAFVHRPCSAVALAHDEIKARSYLAYGLKYEPEAGAGRGISSHGFLGRMPVRTDGGDVVFVDLAVVKKYLFHPSLIEVYGHGASYADHCSVLLCDPESQATPLSRAFARYFQRVCDRHSHSATAYSSWMAWLERHDPYRAEVWEATKIEGCPQVSDEEFGLALLQYADGWCNPADLVADINSLISELDALPGDFPMTLNNSAVLIGLRYRVPWRDRPCSAADLSMVSAFRTMRDLAHENFDSLLPSLQLMSKRGDAKALSKAVNTERKLVRAAIKQSTTKEERKKGRASNSEELAKKAAAEIKSRGGTANRNVGKYFKSVFTRRDAAKLAYMRCVADPFSAASVPIPPLLTPGASTSCPRMYPISLRGVAVSNANGRVYIGLNADGWFPNPTNAAGAAATPWLQYLGNSTAWGGTRGYPVHYTTNFYVGTAVAGSNGNSYPGPTINVAAGTTGLTFLQLPNSFIDVQIGSNPATADNIQRYSCVAAGLRVRPIAPVTGALVPTGTLMMVQQTLGDVLLSNPAAATGPATPGGVDCYAYIAGLNATNSSPLAPGSVGRDEWDVMEWPHVQGERSWLTAAAIPNQSCCFGMWAPGLTGNSTVGYPQLACIGYGMGSGASVEFEAKLVYAFYGGVSYQENFTAAFPAVPADDLAELSAIAPSHMEVGLGHPPGRVAAATVAQSAVDSGRVHPKAAADWIKSGAEVVENVTGSSVAELIGEGLGFLGAMLL